MTFSKNPSSNQMVQPFVQRTFFWEKTILARFILFSRIFLFKPKGTNYCGKDDSWESSYPPRFVLSTSESVFFLRENWRIVLTTKNPPKWPETDDSSEKGLNLSSVLFPKNRPRRRNLFERTEKGESRIFFSKKVVRSLLFLSESLFQQKRFLSIAIGR